jgi:hypothetical protein
VTCCLTAEGGIFGGGRSGPATRMSNRPGKLIALRGAQASQLLRILSISIPLCTLGPHSQAVYDASLAGGPGCGGSGRAGSPKLIFGKRGRRDGNRVDKVIGKGYSGGRGWVNTSM